MATRLVLGVTMIVAGRCHGPGCQREARVEYFCGEACQAAWSRQATKLAADERDLPAVREAMRAELDRVVAETRERARQQIPHTAPGSVVEDIQRAFDLVRDDAFNDLSDDEGAAKPLVASENPQVTHTGQGGWLGRWLHRMRRTP